MENTVQYIPQNGKNNCHPVIIIGAGASGLAMGCQLKRQLGFDQFQIYERQSGIGGVWWSNRYPGVACDVPAAQYSFSFSPNYTSPHIYPTGDEFLEYLQGVVGKFELGKHIQLNADITNLQWMAEDSEWEATISYLVPGCGDLSIREREKKIKRDGIESVCIKQDKVRAKIVVSCAGILAEPNSWPSSIEGRDGFTGEVLHSSRWRNDIDFNDKDIVVIGTGCTAAQIVPSLLKEPYHIKSLTQILRYAPTISRYIPILGFMMRVGLYLLVEVIWFTIFQAKNVKWRKAVEKSVLDRTLELIPTKYHKLMTPDYPYGCKRRVFDSDWLTSMHKPNFQLTERRVLAVDGRDLILGPHHVLNDDDDSMNDSLERINADIIILANGFDATHFLHPIKVRGRYGILLHELWKERGAASAYMGTAVHGFPNFFMVTGPNTSNGHNSIILTSENMVNYIIKIIKLILKGNATVAEIKAEPEAKWSEEVQRDLKGTVFGDCTSWYLDEKGHHSVTYLRSQSEFALRCMFPRYKDWIITGQVRAESKNWVGCVILYGALILLATTGLLWLK